MFLLTILQLLTLQRLDINLMTTLLPYTKQLITESLGQKFQMEFHKVRLRE